MEPLEVRRLLSALDVTSVVWGNLKQDVVRNEYIIQTAMPPTNLNATLNRLGLNSSSTRALGANYYLVTDSIDSVNQVALWSGTHAGVLISMSPNHPVYSRQLPDEAALTTWAAQWHYQNLGQVINGVTGTPGADIDAVHAWSVYTGSQSTVVAVIDTGVNYNDPDLAANMWTNPYEIAGDGIDNDLDGVVDDVHGADFTGTTPTGDPMDQAGHGTEVAGLIGAVGNNGAQGAYVGVNWNVQIMAVRVLDATGTGTDASILAGLNYVTLMKAVKGVNVVAQNLSLGRLFDGPVNGVSDPAIAQQLTAIDYAARNGIITIGATDETGIDLNTTVGTSNDFPTASSNSLFLSVTASNNKDQLASFADSGGNVIDLAAPGDTIAGVGMTASGTSFASPLVAGAVALLRSRVPNASPQQVVDAIKRGVDVVPGLIGKVRTNGRLNVAKSLQILLGDLPVQGHVDVVNSTVVKGWLFDGNVGTDPVYGQLLIDGKFVQVFLANENRPDLQGYLGSTNHGFTVKLPLLTGGQHTIQIIGMNVYPDADGTIQRPTVAGANPHNLNATNGVYNLRAVNIPITASVNGGTGGAGGVISGNLPPRGFVDGVNTSQIVGWAFDPQAGALPVTVQIFIDGSLAGMALADQNRPDLAVLNLGTINHGFTFTTPSNLSVGPHRVSVYAIDTTSGLATLIGAKTLLQNAPLAYFVDNVPGSSTFTGYVYNPDNINQVVPLQVTVDGTAYAYYPTQAAESRIDVPVSNQNHGFTITIPPFLTGTHFVTLTAYNPATGQATVIAARNLGGQTPPVGSLVVNNQTISGFTYDADDGGSTTYRLDVDGRPGNVFTGATQGIANQVPPRAPTPADPVLPNVANNLTLDITQFGARASGYNGNGATGGDGLAPENTFAIQTAINNVSAAGGGTVMITGGYYVSNALTLRSNVNLYIDAGAYLGIAQPATYTGGATAFLRGTNISNFTITGTGTIAGLSGSWTGRANIPPLLQLDASSRILITGVEFANFAGNAIQFGAAMINGQLRATHDVTIDNIVTDFRDFNLNTAVAAPATAVGIMIQGGYNYLIENCNQNLITSPTNAGGVPVTEIGLNGGTGGAIVIAPAQVEATAIHITNNTISRGGGITVGPNTTAGLDDLVVDNVIFNGSTFGVRLISNAGTGGMVQNVYVHDIQLAQKNGTVIDIVTGGNGNRNVPLFQNIVFSGFHDFPAQPTPTNYAAAGATKAGTITGANGQPINGVSLYDMDFTAASGFTVQNVQGFYFDPTIALTLPVNVVLLTEGNVLDFGTETYYYQIATPTLSAGYHTIALYTFDLPSGNVKFIRSQTILVPALSPQNTQPLGVITGVNETGVVGYAIDPNTSAPVTVQVEVDGVLVTSQVANRPQANLPIQFGPNHGFGVPLNLTPGRHVISVYAVDTSDSNIRTLVTSNVVTKGYGAAAAILLARGDYIIAKAFGFANFTASDWVFRVTVDGVTGEVIPASTLGPIVNGVATLVFKTPPIDPTRPHTIAIDYIDPVTQVPATLASAVIAATPGVIGQLTFTSNSLLTGYVYSTAMPEKSLQVLLTVGTQQIRQVTADQNAGRLGAHGFSFSTAGVPVGTHRVTVLAIDPASGLYVVVASAVVTIPSP